ncbi:hypothetical protein SNE40_000573 [Patella caerulea]|uniref:Uncharacterized protein n=1 Tax=Patella caerulea TaxID=87958 RepID=A0AAN8KEZ8_PATCE
MSSKLIVNCKSKSGSLTDLTNEADDVFEEDIKANLGLLRRAFSSMKKRRRKLNSDTSAVLRANKHHPLRAVKSSPPPSTSYFNR